MRRSDSTSKILLHAHEATRRQLATATTTPTTRRETRRLVESGFRTINNSRNRFRLVGFSQAKSLISFSTCFYKIDCFFVYASRPESRSGGYAMIDYFVRNPHSLRLFCPRPALLPTICPQPAVPSTALCVLRICRLADFFFFVVSSQMVAKVSRSPCLNS